MFAVTILLCTWAGIRFLSGLDVFSRNRVYYACYDRISGVQIASPVMIRGVKVGQVSAITLNPSDEKNVVLSLSVQRKYGIPSDSRAKVFSNGLLGSKAVELELGTSSQMLGDGERIATEEERDFMSEAGSSLDDIIAKVDRIASELTTTLESVNRLLEENNDNIGGTVANLRSMTGNLNDVLVSRRAELSDIISNLSQFSEALGRNSERLDSIVMNVDSVACQFADADVAHDLKQTLSHLDAVLTKISDGEGSVSHLVNDAQLYNNLTSASENLSLLLEDLKAHPKRYVHFSLFGRKDKSDE